VINSAGFVPHVWHIRSKKSVTVYWHSSHLTGEMISLGSGLEQYIADLWWWCITDDNGVVVVVDDDDDDDDVLLMLMTVG
jgi:hypothetical protein